MPKSAPKPKATPKAQATGGKILDVALGLFRTKGFDDTTMRDIAAKAGVATGAAYYYYPSKDAIVMAFYQRTFDEMQAKIGKVLDAPGSSGGPHARVDSREAGTLRAAIAAFCAGF